MKLNKIISPICYSSPFKSSNISFLIAICSFSDVQTIFKAGKKYISSSKVFVVLYSYICTLNVTHKTKIQLTEPALQNRE